MFVASSFAALGADVRRIGVLADTALYSAAETNHFAVQRTCSRFATGMPSSFAEVVVQVFGVLVQRVPDQSFADAGVATAQ